METIHNEVLGVIALAVSWFIREIIAVFRRKAYELNDAETRNTQLRNELRKLQDENYNQSVRIKTLEDEKLRLSQRLDELTLENANLKVVLGEFRLEFERLKNQVLTQQNT